MKLETDNKIKEGFDMKKIILLASLFMMWVGIASAQKYACVNTEYILSSIPEYEQAQKSLDKYSIDWQKEIETKFQEIDRLYKSYQTEANLLPDDLRTKRQNEIIAKEKEAKELQRKRFGSGGDLEKKREELMKPIQDRVYSAIEKTAETKNYAFVFDKAGSATLLYVSPKNDISDEILEQLGYGKGKSKTSTK